MPTPWPMKFGAFFAPFHPIGQSPTLALEYDLDQVVQLPYHDKEYRSVLLLVDAARLWNAQQMGLYAPVKSALLEARILNVRPPYANFYRAALGAVDLGIGVDGADAHLDLAQLAR